MNFDVTQLQNLKNLCICHSSIFSSNQGLIKPVAMLALTSASKTYTPTGTKLKRFFMNKVLFECVYVVGNLVYNPFLLYDICNVQNLGIYPIIFTFI